MRKPLFWPCSSSRWFWPRHRVGRTDQGNADVRPAQAATCPRCDRAFRRLGAGKVWSSWSVTP